jgi:O-antigen ligase
LTFSPANWFFTIGLLSIIAEAFFFNYISGLAHSPFGIRAFLGFHFFLSEIWFIGLGNIVVFFFLMQNNLKVPKNRLINIGPVFLVLGVYSFSFAYGNLRGNAFALQDFREMVFNGLSLPVILYLAPYIDIKKVFKRFVQLFLLIIPIWCLIAVPERLLFKFEEQRIAHNAFLLLLLFPLSYYLLSMLLLKRYYMVAVLLTAVPFIASFSKVSVVMLSFSAIVAMAFSAYINPSGKNLLLRKFNLKIVFYIFLFSIIFILFAYSVNKYTGGAIETLIRYKFLKERFSSSGDIYYGEVSGGRFAMWIAVLDSWKHKPFLGHGLGSTVIFYHTGWIVTWKFHNYFFQSLHNTGLVGIVLIIGGWFVWWRRTLGKLRLVQDIYNKIVFVSMAVFVLSVMFLGLFGHSLSYSPVALFFWLCIGVLCTIRESELNIKAQ